MYKFLGFIIVIVVMLYSCSKVKFEQAEFYELSKPILHVVEAKSISSMKKAYLLLSNGEKEVLWRTKLQFILNCNDGILDSEARKVVQGMVDLINQHGMSRLIMRPDIGQAFILSNKAILEAKFSKEQLYLLIELPYFSSDFSLTNARLILNRLNSIVEPNGESVISTLDPDPPKCKCLYDIACPGAGNNCNTNVNCEITVDGCGIFGTASCKGLCEVFP